MGVTPEIVPEIVPVDDELRLRPFADDTDVELAWPWYRDPETVSLVDGPGSPVYARDQVVARYESLAAQGEVYLIERRMSQGWQAVGDVTLAPDTIPIVVAREHRGQGIGRRVVLRLADRARALGWHELRVREVHPESAASHRLFAGVGFVALPAGPPAYVLRLAPLAGRSRH